MRDLHVVHWLSQAARRRRHGRAIVAGGARFSVGGPLPSALQGRPRHQRSDLRSAGRVGRRSGRLDAGLLPPCARRLSLRKAADGIERHMSPKAVSRGSSANGGRAFRMPISPFPANAFFCALRNRSPAIRRWCCGCSNSSARHGIRLSLETERRVRDHKLYLEEYFATSRPLWHSLKPILALPHAAPALRAMHETGLLQIIIPVWEQIECLVVRDFYHRYTVDEHTLVTLEYLEELRATNDTRTTAVPRAARGDREMPLLLMALLFHDMGKSDGLEGHAIASAQISGARAGADADARGRTANGAVPDRTSSRSFGGDELARPERSRDGGRAGEPRRRRSSICGC